MLIMLLSLNLRFAAGKTGRAISGWVDRHIIVVVYVVIVGADVVINLRCAKCDVVSVVVDIVVIEQCH